MFLTLQIPGFVPKAGFFFARQTQTLKNNPERKVPRRSVIIDRIRRRLKIENLFSIRPVQAAHENKWFFK